MLRGPVLHILDGDTLCIALGPSRDRWLRLRLSDSDVKHAATPKKPSRGALMVVAFGQDVDCRITGLAADHGNTAVCEREGRALTAAAAEPDAIRAGRAWR